MNDAGNMPEPYENGFQKCYGSIDGEIRKMCLAHKGGTDRPRRMKSGLRPVGMKGDLGIGSGRIREKRG